MTDLPMFDDPLPPDNVVPIEPKKPRRKKPAKRKAAVRAAAPKKGKKKARALPAPKRVVKKRKVRRGRPSGIPNKPKLVADTSSVATIIGVHAQIESSLSRLSPAERKAMLECLK